MITTVKLLDSKSFIFYAQSRKYLWTLDTVDGNH